MNELFAPLLDHAVIGEIAQHRSQRRPVGILEPEGAGDFAGADGAGLPCR